MQLSKEGYARKRIHNGCLVQIENSVTRVTVRYHSAKRNFQSAPNCHLRFISEFGLAGHVTATWTSVTLAFIHHKTVPELSAIERLSQRNKILVRKFKETIRSKKFVIRRIICRLTNLTICETTNLNLIQTRTAYSTLSAFRFRMKIVCSKTQHSFG